MALVFDNCDWNVPRSCWSTAARSSVPKPPTFTRLVDLLPEHARGELGVERRQGRLGAEARIDSRPGRIVDGRTPRRPPGSSDVGGRPARRPDDRITLLLARASCTASSRREIPDLRRLGDWPASTAARSRRPRPAADVDVGDLELGGDPLVVGQIAVVAKVEGLLGRASGGNGQPQARVREAAGIADSWVHIPVMTCGHHVPPRGEMRE